jgi:hypothetical protein
LGERTKYKAAKVRPNRADRASFPGQDAHIICRADGRIGRRDT